MSGMEDLEELFENAPCGYISAGVDRRIIRANRTLGDWLGCEPGELVGRRVPDLLTTAGKIYFETHFAPLLRMQGFFYEVALDFVRADGTLLPVLVNASERRDEDGGLRFVRLTVFNATDRRRYERELLEARRAADLANTELRTLNRTLESRVEEAVESRLKLEEALRQAQKLEAIGQLTGGVAHDFNNLLTVILGGLEIASKHEAGQPETPQVQRVRRAIAMATQGAERAATLTARLLAFARRQPLAPQPVDASKLVLGLGDLLQRTLGETIAIETVSGAGLWLAHADPSELENALVNLAVNARDAMPGGGRLTIETSNAYLDENYLARVPEPVPPGQYVLLSVSDSGIGMDTATLARVFEPFFTTKEPGKGTGLGLSQVYGFVRQSNGHIRIYSERGLGTTVKIYLPRLPAGSPVLVSSRLEQVQDAAGGTETILLVEDHDDLRSYSGAALRDLGYAVLEAPDGPTALELVSSQPDVALLFTDIVLPGGLNGRELAASARQLRPDLKVLFTTGYSRNAVVHNGRLDPGVHLLPKPFFPAQLAAKVRQVLDI